jgi:hypothetical protein
MYYIATIVCVLFAFAQDKAPLFQPGQSVYVVANKVDTSRSDLSVESDVRREFERKGKFPLAKSPATADFVFIVFTEYDSEVSKTGNGRISSQDRLKHALALAVPAKEYSQHKADIDKLKEFALWEEEEKVRFSVTWVLLSPQNVSAAKLAKKFHDYVLNKK